MTTHSVMAGTSSATLCMITVPSVGETVELLMGVAKVTNFILLCPLFVPICLSINLASIPQAADSTINFRDAFYNRLENPHTTPQLQTVTCEC